MNDHQIKRRCLDGLAPGIVGILVALLAAVLVGLAIHEAFSAVADTLHHQMSQTR